MRTALLGLLALALMLPPAAVASCGATTFQPTSPYIPPGTTHNAYFLTDPAGEQRAVFDLQWGGALAALTYAGSSLLWGNATGGTVEPVLHFTAANGQDYEPMLAGEVGNLGSPVTGVRCVDSNTLYLMTGGLLDFNDGASGHLASNAVLNDAVQGASYATPYAVVTVATFVANSSGPPSYYLELQQMVTNLDPFESLTWTLELAGYSPSSFSTFQAYPANCTAAAPCAGAATAHLIAGLYPNGSLTGGVAFYVSPSRNFPAQSAYAAWQTDSINGNQSVHLLALGWPLAPNSPQSVTWFVLAGNWSAALSFAQPN
jgi:hypothetical protein